MVRKETAQAEQFSAAHYDPDRGEKSGPGRATGPVCGLGLLCGRGLLVGRGHQFWFPGSCITTFASVEIAHPGFWWLYRVKTPSPLPRWRNGWLLRRLALLSHQRQRAKNGGLFSTLAPPGDRDVSGRGCVPHGLLSCQPCSLVTVSENRQNLL